MSRVARKLFSGFPTRSDINQAIQPQEMARGLNFPIYKVKGVFYVVKIEALNRAFGFAYV